MKFPFTLVLSLLVTSCATPRGASVEGPDSTQFVVAAYWTGFDSPIDRFPIDELTHINYAFVRLHDGRVDIRGAEDSASLAQVVALKKTHPRLKVAVSLGGWGGCEPCSNVFSTEDGRRRFALSVKSLLQRFGLDGIDLDWEYPAIEGYPRHPFAPEDRHNFTLLVGELRRVLGDRMEITFAAGAFPRYLEESIEWGAVAPLVDRVYLMTYDFVNGASTQTGHHTSLYSTAAQPESADFAVHYLDSLGVPRKKLVIGAAFYARVWSDVPDTNRGLYQNGRFSNFVGYRDFDAFWAQHPGFIAYWDSSASAPYRYNPRERLFATFDDPRSIALKTRYAVDHGLGGVMFWQLNGDRERDGLLDVIWNARKSADGSSAK